LPRCQYQYKSRTVGSSGVPSRWPRCVELTNGRFCIFRDKEHLEENKQKVTKRFEKKVRDSLFEEKPLDCVGFYLPHIDFAKLLRRKTFSQAVIFIDATFYEGLNLSGVTFSEAAFFMDATFLGDLVNFSEAIFAGAFFNGAKFSPETRFARADFYGEANFLDSAFSGEVDFSRARFFDEANFTKVIFEGKVFFYDATFHCNTGFREIKFSEEAFFSGATFTEQVDFTLSRFLKEATFEGTTFAAKTKFRKVSFEQPTKVIFDDIDASNVSFAESDITKTRFGDNVRWGGNDKLTIIEEEWLKNQAEGRESSSYERVSLGLVLSIYRNLRENYEFKLRYDEAGMLFVKEMELKRKYRYISSRFDRFLVWLHGKLRMKWDTKHLPKALVVATGAVLLAVKLYLLYFWPWG
jgi:uncharacterized protein YjbI with pentapeptide repeats